MHNSRPLKIRFLQSRECFSEPGMLILTAALGQVIKRNAILVPRLRLTFQLKKAGILP